MTMWTWYICYPKLDRHVVLPVPCLITILKGKRNAYFDFQNVGFILRRNFVLIKAIYTHWYRQLNSSTSFFNFCWWRIPLAMTSLPWIGVTDFTRRKPELENKSLSKKMDRWIIFRLKVVSLITNDDNSWLTFPVCKRFRCHEWKFLFLRLNDSLKRLLHIVNILQSRSKEFGTKIIKKYPREPSLTKISSIRFSCINTMQFLCFLNWYCFGTT